MSHTKLLETIAEHYDDDSVTFIETNYQGIIDLIETGSVNMILLDADLKEKEYTFSLKVEEV